MKNTSLKLCDSVKFQMFVLLFLANGFFACNKRFIKFPLFNTNASIPSTSNLPPLFINKDSLLTFQSISTLDRRFESGKAGLNRIKFMKVDNKDGDSTYNRTLRNLLKLQTEFNIEIVATKNDSLFKEIMTDTFLQNFNHLDMQKISFSNNVKNGLNLIITNLIYDVGGGGVGIGGNLQSAGHTGANILYEFFYVQNGEPIQYTGFSLGRDYTFSFTRGGPKLKEMRWVLKNLYKQSEKYYGANKKE